MEPTKTATVKKDGELNQQLMEFEAKHSVELTNTVKDGWRVSAVKIYHNDPYEAAQIAVKVAIRAENELKDTIGKEPA